MKKTRRLASFGTPASLLLICSLIYLQTLGFEFLRIDDDVNVFNNPHFLKLSWDSVAGFWTAPYERLYIPVTYSLWAAVHATEIALGGTGFQPWVYHFANVVLHALNAWLVFEIAAILLSSRVAAGWAAFFFLVHPFQVESVAWVTSFRGLVSSAFALGLILHFCRQKGRVWDAKAFSIGMGLFLLALLSKPSAIGVLPVLVFLGWGWYRESFRGLLWFSTACIVVAVPIALLTKAEQPDAISGIVVPLLSRPAIALDAIAFYWTKSWLAWDFGLDYARTPASVVRNPAFVSIGFCLSTIFLFNKLPTARLRLEAFMLVGAFAASLAPVSGLVPFQFQNYSTVADRYAYFALVPLSLLVARLVCHFRFERPAAAFLLILALQSAYMTSFWRNEYTLFERTVAQNPESVFGHNNLGFSYGQRGDWEKAVEHYEKAVSLVPYHPVLKANLEKAYQRIKKETVPSESASRIPTSP